MPGNPPQDRISFVIGEDKAIDQILSRPEVEPLLLSLIEAGAQRAVIADDCGQSIWHAGAPGTDEIEIRLPISIEGAPTNRLSVYGSADQRSRLEPLARLFKDLLQTIVNNSLKRMLTTEIHTTVVNQSYDALVETNQRLTASEARYKALAENLEKIVETRTAELKQAQASLLQREKLAAIGQLAAGMAHEINNPLGFVASNLSTLQRYVAKMREMLLGYHEAPTLPLAEGERDRLHRQWESLKLDWILSDADQIFTESLAGCERIGNIVADLKAFAHLDEGDKAAIDLREELDRILRVLAPRIPPDCTIIREYQEGLAPFTCNPAQIAQALMALVVNALQTRAEGLQLTLTIRQESDTIVIGVKDNGPGIPAEIIDRIFEPFFTTREVGSGIGLGLTSAYDIVTSYGGTIAVASPPGCGAEFTISLPLTEAIRP